ncbi:MAG TPA: SusC/RagA family TonB-linked outer membrane protein [Flavisolibacter sp.]|jgi:TonB-linked SusC/RagA family outer membrane protein|nr:SusC/RagA family TonB-linked outer membrane protein [Flavisolibacter sp.]
MKKMIHRFLALLCFIALSIAVFAQEKKTVTGVVKDNAGKVLEGATIREKGTSNIVASDQNGAFSIRVTPSATLVVSYIGLGETEIKTGSASSYDVTLRENQNSMEGVVVTALGIRREQRKIGYATTTVTGKEIIKTAPTNFASALAGKAAGVQVYTQPGGATSAVSIQIRGINSLTNQGQPLLVVDGVIVRNGDANNEGYWGGNQKLNGNGLLDINPENIETINILKGAAASALYGSDANFGVIVITTKNGKGYNKGIGVDVNLSANSETVAVTPDLQTEYGPGYDRGTNVGSFGSDDEGWIHMTVNGQAVVRPIFRAYGQFGPKLDGRQVYWWDGQMRDYSPQKDNWKAFYRNGYSTIANIALNNANDKMNYRFSYTRNDYKGIQIGGNSQKNTFNFNSSFKILPKVSLDLVTTYINEKVHNRPRQIYYLTNNFGGFFSPAEHMDVLFNKYQTTKGYKWVDYNQTQLDPEEALKYNIRPKDFLDFLWNQLANSYDETSNRLIASATVNYNILKGLNLRGRYGTDYTGFYQESKFRSTQPLSFGASGGYNVDNNRYMFNYGDLLLSYQHNIVQNLGVTASVGYQARKEDYRYANSSTRDGLTAENWFSFNASKNTPTGNASRGSLVKDGLFGILSFDYHNYLFLEGTIRRERTSSLYFDKNTFYYPGVSASFELSNAFKLPAFVSYSKLRTAWGIVGNPPPAFFGNVNYIGSSVQGIPILTPPQSQYGNRDLKNESKRGLEFGWESRFVQSRVGFDITYYNDKVKDQIMYLTTPATVGSGSVAVNVGDMRNYGVELSVFGTPIKSKSIIWDSRLNLGFNRNKVIELMEGLDYLDQANIDNGSLLVRSKPGEAAGNIYVYKRKTDASGNYLVDDNGFYIVNYDEMQKAGNIQSKVTGGFINTISYKNLSLNVLVDFRYGGQVISAGMLYNTGAGMYTNSLAGRDAAHGGIPYYVDANGKYVRVADNATQGPGGQKVYHDGIIVSGVRESDSKPNETILDAANYYLTTYTWGSWPGYQSGSLYEGAVFNNDFVKLREASLSYTLPLNIRSKLKMQNLVFTVYGRNLFYFHKTLPNLDPEEGVGTSWVSRSTSFGSGSAATRSLGASIRLTF